MAKVSERLKKLEAEVTELQREVKILKQLATGPREVVAEIPPERPAYSPGLGSPWQCECPSCGKTWPAKGRDVETCFDCGAETVPEWIGN